MWLFCQERMDKKILRALLCEQGTMQSQIQRELQLEQIPWKAYSVCSGLSFAKNSAEKPASLFIHPYCDIVAKIFAVGLKVKM